MALFPRVKLRHTRMYLLLWLPRVMRPVPPSLLAPSHLLLLLLLLLINFFSFFFSSSYHLTLQSSSKLPVLLFSPHPHIHPRAPHIHTPQLHPSNSVTWSPPSNGFVDENTPIWWNFSPSCWSSCSTKSWLRKTCSLNGYVLVVVSYSVV